MAQGTNIRPEDIRQRSVEAFSPRGGKKREGFYIVEAMIALSVLVVGFLGLLALLSNSLSTNRVVSDTYVANYLAMEGIEIVKNTVDANIAHGQNFNKNCVWDAGFSTARKYAIDINLRLVSKASLECPGDVFGENIITGNVSPLKFDETTGRYGYSSGNDSRFTRVIEIIPQMIDERQDKLTVKSTVSWTTRGGGKFDVTMEDRLYNWLRP